LREFPGDLPRLGPAIIVRRRFQPAEQRRPRPLKMMSMPKIKVKTPVVELDGDEMSRVIWSSGKNRLILPHPDVDLKCYALGVESRDARA
jgi:isocitrate dehydrogenase